MAGVAATNYIKDKTAIAFIPQKLIISLSSILKSELKTFIS